MRCLATISTNFPEYKYHSEYLADDFESAREYLHVMLTVIEDDTSSDRQRKFAQFLKNRVKNDKTVSVGYGKDEYIAVDIVELGKIDDKIKSINEEISRLSDKLDSQYKILGR